MSKSRPQVKSKLNKWYDWLINHVSKPIKDGASRAFKTFKDKIMGLYNRVTGSAANQTQRSGEPEPFKPIELEQAFGESYRRYRVNGTPKIDVGTFFSRIRKGLIELIKQELKTRTSARIQTTRFNLIFKFSARIQTTRFNLIFKGLGSLGMTRRARKKLS